MSSMRWLLKLLLLIIVDYLDDLKFWMRRLSLRYRMWRLERRRQMIVYELETIRQARAQFRDMQRAALLQKRSSRRVAVICISTLGLLGLYAMQGSHNEGRIVSPEYVQNLSNVDSAQYSQSAVNVSMMKVMSPRCTTHFANESHPFPILMCDAPLVPPSLGRWEVHLR
jgi:ribonuclease D